MKGVKRFVLEVSSENYKAKNLYENIGFKIVGYRKSYYNVKANKYNTTKSDAEIMEYKI
jgi:ribosomal protein S18 acetylase RimI-like enzyme